MRCVSVGTRTEATCAEDSLSKMKDEESTRQALKRPN